MARGDLGRRIGEWAARVGLGRLWPGGPGRGALFYNCGRQGARSWWERTDVAAGLLERLPEAKTPGLRVFDIGCGDEKFAVELERRGLSVAYQGHDLHPQSPRVRPLDLARQTIDGEADVAVVLGVLEYLDDPVAALGRLAAAAPILIISHAASDLGRSADFDPASLNWRLYVDRPTFEGHLAAAGWRVTDRRVTPDGKTAVWACRRGETRPAG